MKRLGWRLWSVAPLAMFTGITAAADAGQPEADTLDHGFLEFLAEEAGVDEELTDALMSSDLDRALEQSRRRSKVDADGNE